MVIEGERMNIDVRIDDNDLQERLGENAPLLLTMAGAILKPLLSSPILIGLQHNQKLVFKISLEEENGADDQKD